MSEAIRVAPLVLPKSVADMAIDTMTQHGVSAVQDEGESWRCRSCDYFLFPEEIWEGPCDCVAWRWVRVILDLPVTPQASSAERSEEDVCRCTPTPSADPAPAVSYDELVDWVTRLEVTVKPVNGVVTIMAESMADRIAEFLGANGVEVQRADP